MSSAGAFGYVAAGALLYSDSILIRPKRGLDLGVSDIVAQVTIEEVHRDDVKITEHPVEFGANVADHAFELPATLVVRYGWSNSPSAPNVLGALSNSVSGTAAAVQSRVTGNQPDQVRDVYKRLLRLKAARDPFTVYTGKRKYEDMLIESIAVTTDKANEQSMIATITLKQIMFVRVNVSNVAAPAANQAEPESTTTQTDSGVKMLAPTTSHSMTGGGRGF